MSRITLTVRYYYNHVGLFISGTSSPGISTYSQGHTLKSVLHEDTDAIPLQNCTKWSRSSFFLYLGDANLLLAVIQTTILPIKVGPFTALLQNTGILRSSNCLVSENNLFLKVYVQLFQYSKCMSIYYYSRPVTLCLQKEHNLYIFSILPVSCNFMKLFLRKRYF